MSPSPPLFVTGGSGTIGAHLLRLLAEQGVPVRALARQPRQGEPLPGVEWVEGDLADRDSFIRHLDGCERLFLLSGNGDAMVRLQKNAVRAARDAGLLHVVKLSAFGASDHSRSLIGTWHWIVEQELRTSGPAWTILRPHSFMQNLLDQRRAILGEGEVRSPAGDGRVPLVDTRDVAEVAARVLTTAGHGSRTYTLTGPEAITHAEATAVLAEVLGRPLRFVAESPDEARRRMADGGAPPWLIAAQLAIAAYQQASGPTAVPTTTVEELLGRPARSFREFARDHAGDLLATNV
jgi:uncharacterized protein YbjT (DUF2867 family)